MDMASADRLQGPLVFVSRAFYFGTLSLFMLIFLSHQKNVKEHSSYRFFLGFFAGVMLNFIGRN